MIGFIKKDFAMIKSNLKLLSAIIIVYLIMGLLNKMDISFIIPFMSVMLMISTFSYDSYNKWDAYAITLPNGRKNSVKAKYVSTILMTLVVSIVLIIFSFIISYINNQSINYAQILITMLGSIFGTLLTLALMYPIIYKLGVEKARISIFVIVFALIIGGGLIINLFDFSTIAKKLAFLEDYLIIILILIMIIMVYISYKISLKIMAHKEF